MPDSITSAFSEPEDFEAALQAQGFFCGLITACGQFRARLTQILLNELCLSAAEERSARIAFTEIPRDTVQILFAIGNASAPVCGGIGLDADELMLLHPSEQFYARINGASDWGSVRLPVDGLVKYGVALTGAAFSIPSSVRCWRPPSAAGRRLRSLHAAAIRMAEKSPQALIDAEAVHGLEQQLLHAVLDCLSNGSAKVRSRAERRGQEVMVRFEQLLQNGQGINSSMSEICATLQVSERRLRSLCAGHLGMSPTAYDRLRRMSLVRRALLCADSVAEKVSVVARQNGFRDLGRFAVNYRAAFGEPPSTTLHRKVGAPSTLSIFRRLTPVLVCVIATLLALARFSDV